MESGELLLISVLLQLMLKLFAGSLDMTLDVNKLTEVISKNN